MQGLGKLNKLVKNNNSDWLEKSLEREKLRQEHSNYKEVIRLVLKILRYKREKNISFNELSKLLKINNLEIYMKWQILVQNQEKYKLLKQRFEELIKENIDN